MKDKWKLWLAAVIVIGVLFLVARNQMSRGGGLQTEAPAVAKTVYAQTVGKSALAPALTLTGSVEAGSETVISAKVGGRVAEVMIKDGEAVAAGQPLVLLEDTDYWNALTVSQAALVNAQANLKAASSNYARCKSLFENGALPEKDLEAAKTALDIAQAGADSASAGLDNAKNSLQNTVISSPAGGLATDCNVKVGQFLSTGTPLLKVMDISSVYAVVSVEQGNLAAIKPGLSAEVTSSAFSDRVFSGTVELINPVASDSARVFETKIRVSNSDHMLRPGMFVKVEIKTGASVPVIAVPQSAVVDKSGLYYVFVVEGDQVKRIQVEIGQVIGQSVEIKSGLSEGQQVVITNVDTLKDQDLIIISE